MADENSNDKSSRRLGFAAGQIFIPDSFFDPLPYEILKYFLGEDDESYDVFRNPPASSE